ncbi:hypothetical protein N2152v2_006527 [Parachlorella kessleri]
MSKQRSIRKKTLSFDGEEDEGSGALPPASVRAAQARRDKDRKGAEAKKPILSFDEDLGASGGVSKDGTKKSSSKPKPSLRAPLPPKAESAAGAAAYTQVSAAGEYTADRLKELQKNALRAPSTTRPAERPVPGQSRGGGGGGGFKLSGSFKPAGAPKDSRFEYDVRATAVVQPPAAADSQRQQQQQQGRSLGRPASGAALAEDGPDAGGEAEMPLPPPPLPAGAAPGLAGRAGSAAGSAGESDVEDELDIPDERMIQWAKAKRERLRSAHLAPDYIPTAAMPGLTRLRDKKSQEEQVGAGSGSDDELEEGMRLQFMGPAGKAGKAGSAGSRQRRDKAPPPPGVAAAAAAGVVGGEEEEDDESHWAQEQIRKGMGGLMRGGAEPAACMGGAARGGSSGSLLGDGQQQLGGPDPAMGLVMGGGTAGAGFGFGVAAGGSQAGKISADAEAVLRALQAGLQRLQARCSLRTSHKQAERNMQRTTGNLQGAIVAIARMEGELQSSSDKYVYLQKIRAYIQDLCYMLQDKSPLVEELEDQLLQLYKERSDAFQERRRLDDQESQQPAEAAVSAALGVLSRGGTLASAVASADVAAQRAEQAQQAAGLPPELDEFGRDLNAERRREAGERAKRRQARLEAAAAQLRQHAGQAQQPGGAELRLGEATSEESEGEASHFQLRQGEILEASVAVFKDASDEFSSIPAVKSQLEEWKGRYPGAYRDAYMSISAPALFAPFVRLELLRWRPLEGAGAGFDAHQWYQQLFDYGMGPDPAAADPEDPDANLIPQLVQKLVLPLARHLLESVWDPFSARKSRAAAGMLEDLLVYVPAEDEGLQGLLRLVQSRLESAIASVALPAWPPQALAASPRAEAFLSHRFGRALRLLRAVCGFEGTLARGVLQDLALQRLVSQQLMPFIRVAASDTAKAADRVQRVVTLLPTAWFQGGPLRGCEGLLDFINTMARSLEAQAGEAEAKAAHAAAAKQLSGALLRLGGDTARANRLAKAYGVL